MAHDSIEANIVALARLISRLNADLDPEAVIRLICAETALALGVPGVAVGIYHEQLNLILHIAAHGVDALAARSLIPPPYAPAPAQLYVVPITHEQADLIGRDLGIDAFGYIGLWHSTRPLGAIVVALPAGRAGFAPAEGELLGILADLAAQAVVSAIRLASAHSRAEDLEAINTLSRALAETLELERIYELLYEFAIKLLPNVAGAIFTLFDAELQQMTCAFAILDGERLDTSEFPPLSLAPLGQGTQSNVIHTRQPVIVGSFEELIQRSQQVVEIGTSGDITESILFVPMLARERVVGVLQAQSYFLGNFSMAHAATLGLAANVAAVAIENARLVNDLRRSNSELRQAYDSTLEGWSHALDLRDRETEGHSQRVTDLTVRLMRAVGMSDEQVAYARWGALLHDIGKMGVPDAVLLKPGPLDDEEWRLMRLHPVHAYHLLAPIEFLQPALDIPYCHHEKWDGSGYPRGLRGDEIPLAARLFAVVDIWDALRADRPYRKAWPEEKVRAHLLLLAGNHLDPAAVELFFHVIDE